MDNSDILIQIHVFILFIVHSLCMTYFFIKKNIPTSLSLHYNSSFSFHLFHLFMWPVLFLTHFLLFFSFCHFSSPSLYRAKWSVPGELWKKVIKEKREGIQSRKKLNHWRHGVLNVWRKKEIDGNEMCCSSNRR